MYLGFFCADDADTVTAADGDCESAECFGVDENLDIDDGLSHFTSDEAAPLNVSRDVLVFLHIQKTVRQTTVANLSGIT